MLRASGVPTSDKGQGRGFYLSLSLCVNCFSFDSLASSATTYFSLNQRNETRVNRTHVSGNYHLSDVCAGLHNKDCLLGNGRVKCRVGQVNLATMRCVRTFLSGVAQVRHCLV